MKFQKINQNEKAKNDIKEILKREKKIEQRKFIICRRTTGDR